MPGPVSRTDTWNEPLFASALMATSPASVNLMALPTRLISTCVKRRSSARAMSIMPSALAVLRLIASSYLFGACTGRSAGLSPLKMRSAVALTDRKTDVHFVAGHLLLFDPVQVPPLGHAFESVNAAILKADSRLRHQILDRARNQDFTGTRFRGDARADVKRETDHVSTIHFIFACVQPHPDL